MASDVEIEAALVIEKWYGFMINLLASAEDSWVGGF